MREEDVEVNKYVVFMGSPYYPKGGNEDFLQYTSSIEYAIDLIEGNREKLLLLQDINTTGDIWVTIATSKDMATVKSGFYEDYKEEWEWQDGEFDHYKRKD